MKLMIAFDLLTDGFTGAGSDAVGGRIGNKSESKSREASNYSGQAARRLKSNPPLPAVAGERGDGHGAPHEHPPSAASFCFCRALSRRAGIPWATKDAEPAGGSEGGTGVRREILRRAKAPVSMTFARRAATSG